MIGSYNQIPKFSLSANFQYIFKLYVNSFMWQNVPLFQEAWRRIMERHPIFRATLDVSQTEWCVRGLLPLPFHEEDWQEIDLLLIDRKLDLWLSEDRCVGFEGSVLFRLKLFRLGPQDFTFVWTSHHALLDGRSRLIVLEELFGIYESLFQRQEVQLPEALPFWQHHWEQDLKGCSKPTEFWQNYFRGFEPMSSMRLSFKVGSSFGPENSHGVLRLACSFESTVKLEVFCTTNGITLNTLLQGAWAILLSRYLGRDDVLFGATRACRGRKTADTRVGLLINTLPVRVRIPESMPTLDWLRDLRSQWIRLREYELTPLQEIHFMSGCPPEVPLFESILVLEKYELNSYLRKKGGMWSNRSFQVRGLTHYPLVMACYLSEGLGMELTYSRELFEEGLISRLGEHFLRILESLVEVPNLRDLNMLSPEEEHRLLVEWNQTSTDYPSSSSISQEFEERVKEMPDAIALEAGSHQLSYGQLNARANQLACELLKSIPTGHTVIGLLMERSMEAVIGFLAILKAGCTCVPLDPGWPGERLLQSISEAGIGSLLVHGATSEKVSFTPVKVLNIAALDLEQYPVTNPPILAGPDSIASIMFTSGSTGKPKGARIRHRSILRLVRNTNYCRFGREEVFIQFAPLSFDASTFEIWGSLLNGAKLVIAPHNLPSLDELGKWVRDFKITTLWLNACLFHEMVDGPIAASHGGSIPCALTNAPAP